MRSVAYLAGPVRHQDLRDIRFGNPLGSTDDDVLFDQAWFATLYFRAKIEGMLGVVFDGDRADVDRSEERRVGKEC